MNKRRLDYLKEKEVLKVFITCLLLFISASIKYK